MDKQVLVKMHRNIYIYIYIYIMYIYIYIHVYIYNQQRNKQPPSNKMIHDVCKQVFKQTHIYIYIHQKGQ